MKVYFPFLTFNVISVHLKILWEENIVRRKLIINLLQLKLAQLVDECLNVFLD